MVIKNGRTVSSESVLEKDIRIRGGKIEAVENSISPERNENVLDAGGRYILPGGVDVHTHMNLDAGIAVASDDFYTGTSAALRGGTTTIVDHMGFGPSGCPLEHQLNYYHSIADNKAVIDYSFHGVIQHVDEDVLLKMELLKKKGLSSYKIYTTYSYSLSDDDIYKVMKRASELDLVVCAHPEDDPMMARYTEKLIKSGSLSCKYYPLSRPADCEAAAVKRLASIAESIGGVKLYIVHVSSEQALNEVLEARNRGYKTIFAETCPQYLFLNDSLYSREDGLKYVLSPPLRNISNNGILFRAIKNRDIQTVGTDHCPFFYETEKLKGSDDFRNCPKGLPGVQLRMSLMISRALENIDITLEDVVRTCCENPAKIFGLYPDKGIIAPGSDADLIIADPDAEQTVRHADLCENVDYTPYENIHLKGKIEKVFFKGHAAEDNCRPEKGGGRFISRK